MEGSETTEQTHAPNNEKRIALWPARNREGGGDKPPPYLTGHFTLDGQKYLVALWQRERTSDRQPVLSGHIQAEINLDV